MNQNYNYNFFNKVITQNKLSHAMLFEVDDYEDSMSFLINIVKLILCNNSDKSLEKLNCNNCNICKLIDSNSYPDLKIIETDGNWIKKQQLMDLQKDFGNKSLFNNKKIYIIKEAEKLNVSSSNSLLKFLEEPSDDVVAILVTKNRYLLLDTILSRCQLFSLKKDDIILENFNSEEVENFIEYLARQKNLMVNYKDIYENVFKEKNNAKEVLSSVEKYFLYYLSNKNELSNSDNYVISMLDRISINKMVLYVQIIEQELQKLEFNVNFKIWCDSFFARIIGEVYD